MTVNDLPTDLALEPTTERQQFRIVHRMRRAFLSICRCGDTVFSPYGLTTDQYALMRAVQREPGIRQADLGNVIFAQPNTVTAMVTLLEKKGILRRRPSPTDGRARLLHLTARGEKVMQRLSDDWQPMRTLIYDCFAGPTGEEALRILDRVYEAMHRERQKSMIPVADDAVMGRNNASSRSIATAMGTGAAKPARLPSRRSSRK
jgi:DNA-binding MarR family transcriptional regulator